MTSAALQDKVFSALADPSRRRMLDMLRKRPGLTSSALADQFPFSRIAVIKHVQVLERGGLVTRRRDGKSVGIFPTVELPAKAVADWLATCQPLWVQRLRDLKTELERPERPMPNEPCHVYVTYIRTKPELLWAAITRPEITCRYFFGTSIRSTLAPGAPIEYMLRGEDGAEMTAVAGEVLEVEPPRRLVHTFRFPHLPDAATRVTYEIEVVDAETVKLTLTHDGFDGVTPTHREVGGGWPRVLSSLKSLLETGTPLDVV
jgi:uncharacterized protein YndB with AHSA1/START domain/DNA-binding transcriptional ArsR family regulator